MLRFVEIDKTEHPRRREMSNKEMCAVLDGIFNGEDWMSIEDLEAAEDHIFDYVTATKQTVEGVLTIQ